MSADDAEPDPAVPDSAVGWLLPLPRLVEAAVVVALLLALLAAGAATLVMPAQAVTALDIVLAVAAAQALLLRAGPCAALTVTSAAAVALPPVMRGLWQGTGLPTIVDDALAAARQVPSHPGALGVLGPDQISPLPGVAGPAGLLAAVGCVLALTGAVRAFRTAAWGRRLTPPTVPQPDRGRLEDTLLPLPREVVPATDWTPPRETQAEPVTAEPAGVELRPPDPAAPERVAVEPVAPERVAAERVAAEPVALEPVAPEPAAPEPVPLPRIDRLLARPGVRRLLLRRPRGRRPGVRQPVSVSIDPMSHPADDSWRDPGRGRLAPAPTGLPGREAFLERLRAALADQAARDQAAELAVFVVEVDRLDGLLDALGRTATEDVVRQVSRRLRAWLPGPDGLARLGTGSFAVLVQGGAAEDAARRMSALLAEPMAVAGQTASVSFSIGICATGPGDADRSGPDGAARLLAQAQDAAEQAARDGRARWVRHGAAAAAQGQADGLLELEFRQALRHRQIRASFQPIVRLGEQPDADRPIAVEALARWTTRAGTAVEPARFVALAESAGLGPELGRQVLECGLDAVAGWYADGYPVGRLAVNLAQSQLDSPDFLGTVTSQLARRQLPGGCLVVELAAGRFVATPQALLTLDRLTGLGAQVLLDDFGVPGVSVSGLSDLPLSGVKLDRSLTGDLGPVSPAAAAVALCRSLGLRSIAEGIETAEQLAQARTLGVDAVQGYLLARPARARDVTSRLAASREAGARQADSRATAARVPAPRSGPGTGSSTGSARVPAASAV